MTDKLNKEAEKQEEYIKVSKDFLSAILSRCEGNKSSVYRAVEETVKLILSEGTPVDEWISVVTECVNCKSKNIITEPLYRCKDCNCFHDKNWMQL